MEILRDEAKTREERLTPKERQHLLLNNLIYAPDLEEEIPDTVLFLIDPEKNWTDVDKALTELKEEERDIENPVAHADVPPENTPAKDVVEQVKAFRVQGQGVTEDMPLPVLPEDQVLDPIITFIDEAVDPESVTDDDFEDLPAFDPDAHKPTHDYTEAFSQKPEPMLVISEEAARLFKDAHEEDTAAQEDQTFVFSDPDANNAPSDFEVAFGNEEQLDVAHSVMDKRNDALSELAEGNDTEHPGATGELLEKTDEVLNTAVENIQDEDEGQLDDDEPDYTKPTSSQMTLYEALELFEVLDPSQRDEEDMPEETKANWPEGWYAFQEPDGITAYFGTESAALAWRLFRVNLTLNGKDIIENE